MLLDKIDNLLQELSVVLPTLDTRDLNLESLMSWDMHNLEGQYKTDSLMLAFFTLVSKDAKHLAQVKKDALASVEAAVYEDIKVSEPKLSETAIAKRVVLNDSVAEARATLRTAEYKESVVAGILTSLEKKYTALTMLASREKAEIAAGIH